MSQELFDECKSIVRESIIAAKEILGEVLPADSYDEDHNNEIVVLTADMLLSMYNNLVMISLEEDSPPEENPENDCSDQR